MKLKMFPVVILFLGLFVMLNGCASAFKKAMLAESLPHVKEAYEKEEPSKQLKYLSSKNIDGTSPLIYAVSKNNLDITRYLVEKGAGVNVAVKSAKYASTPLLAAIGNGNPEISFYLISKEADINYSGYGTVTPLALAISKGLRKVMDIMEDSGMLNKESYESALYNIVTSGESLEYKKEKIDYYLEKGASLDMRDKTTGNSPLMGIPGGDSALTEYLISKGADVNAANSAGVTPLMVHSGNLTMVKYLVSKGASLKAVDNNGDSLLMYAAAFNNVNVFNYYLGKGLNIDAQNNSGKTVLMYSIEKGRGTDFVRYLVDNGAEIEIQDKDKRTAMNYAAFNNDIETVKFLASCGANFRNPEILSDSVMENNNDTEMLSYMVKGGAGSKNMTIAADPSSEESKALLKASQLHNFEAQKVLARAGAELDITDINGRNLWHYAAEKYIPGQMDYLAKSIPQQMASRDKNGVTPLMVAAKANNMSAAAFLVEAGVPVGVRDNSGNNVIYYAYNSDMKKYLQRELDKEREREAARGDKHGHDKDK